MADYRNPDNIGNRFEIFGSEGWPELQESDLWEDIPEQDRRENDDD